MPSLMATSLRWRMHSARTNLVDFIGAVTVVGVREEMTI